MRRYYMRTNNEPPRNPDGSPTYPIIRTYVAYGECQKNQAEHNGGQTVNGCGEFMPVGEEGTYAAFICGGCGCHRTYHLLEVHTQIVWNGPPPPPPPTGAAQGA